jgi:hypothetical protein
LPGGCTAGKSLAPAKRTALKTEDGKLYHHVKGGSRVADIYDVIIAYSNDQT